MLLTVSACTQGSPTPGVSPSESMSVDSSPAPTPVESIPPEAVVTIASVDVDGLNVSVSGYVSGVIQDEGECLFVLTNEAVRVEIATSPTPDASSTSCGLGTASIDQFSPGTWQAVLNYTSGSLTIESNTVNLEIP